jgi:hypothetical protein
MARGDGDLWRTLVLLYSAVLVAAVCVPLTTALPLLLGVDSFLLLLCSGCFGLLVTGGGVGLLVGRSHALAPRSGDATASDRPNSAGDGADRTMPDEPR